MEGTDVRRLQCDEAVPGANGWCFGSQTVPRVVRFVFPQCDRNARDVALSRKRVRVKCPVVGAHTLHRYAINRWRKNWWVQTRKRLACSKSPHTRDVAIRKEYLRLKEQNARAVEIAFGGSASLEQEWIVRGTNLLRRVEHVVGTGGKEWGSVPQNLQDKGT